MKGQNLQRIGCCGVWAEHLHLADTQIQGKAQVDASHANLHAD